jgi:TolC family type I secretion outer membrane protein
MTRVLRLLLRMVRMATRVRLARLARPLRIPRLAFVLMAIPAAGAFPLAADANAASDLFQPDVLRTDPALERRTVGLDDPRGRTCPVPAGPLSLATAVNLALCNNPATRSSWAAAREASAELGGAESAWLPTVSATGAKTRTYGEYVDATGNLVSGPENTRDAALNLSWTLYDFGGRSGRVRSARGLLDAAADTLSSVSQQTVAGVVQSYYAVVAADATLRADRITEETAARSLDIARSLRDGGVATLADVLQAQSAHDLAVLTRVQAELSVENAHGALAVEIGSPADRPLALEAASVPAEVPALDARMADLMAEATRQRPDLAAALAARDAAEANVTVARAVGRPSISIQAGRSLAYTPYVANQNYNQIGLYVTVPIFSGFSTTYGVRQAQAALEASDANVEQARLQVSLGVWNAYHGLESANRQLGATALLTSTAGDNQEVALGRYRSGVGTIIDVLTAQTAAAGARLLRIDAEFGWEVARAQLALALGRLTGADPLDPRPDLP